MIPHISNFKTRWVRRVMIVVLFLPVLIENLVLSTINTFRGAALWWKQP